jgi:hypothetical protein
MATTPHIRLAVVSTSGGDIVSNADCRGGHNIVVPYASGGVRRTIEAHAVDDALLAAESGSVHTNLDATTTVALTLPTDPAQGTEFTFAVQAGQELRIDPGTATIRDSAGQVAGSYFAASAIGASLTVVADSNGDWAVTAKAGMWTLET